MTDSMPPGSEGSSPETRSRGRISDLKEKSDVLRERADETWKRVEESRSRKPFVDVAFEAYERDRDHLGPLLSAAIAFRLFLVLVPYVALGVVVFGFFNLELDDLQAAGITGLVARSISASGDQPLWSQIVTFLVIAWALLLAARSMVKALRLTHAVAWDLGRSPSKDTTRAALWLVLFATAAIAATGVARQIREASATPGLIATLFVFVVYLAAWVAASMSLPRPDGTRWTTMLPGSALFALGAQAFQVITMLWIIPRVDNAQDRYGALGLAIVLLGGIYLIGRLMVAAAFVNATLWFRGRRGEPVPGVSP